jgi:hypothetical protein
MLWCGEPLGHLPLDRNVEQVVRVLNLVARTSLFLLDGSYEMPRRRLEAVPMLYHPGLRLPRAAPGFSSPRCR